MTHPELDSYAREPGSWIAWKSAILKSICCVWLQIICVKNIKPLFLHNNKFNIMGVMRFFDDHHPHPPQKSPPLSTSCITGLEYMFCLTA